MLYYNSGNDDCLACCVAGILDLDLYAVINVDLLPEGQRPSWFVHLNTYMKLRHNVEVIAHKPDEIVEGYVVGIHLSLTGNSSHATIMEWKEGEYKTFFDPNPERPIYGELKAIIELKRGYSNAISGGDAGEPPQ